jgi:hypothetical protein
MVGTILDKIASRVDQRFLATLLVPSFVFLTAIGALVATELGWSHTLAWWDGLRGSQRALVVTASVATLLLAAVLLGTWTRSLVRLYEGYWGHGPVAQICTGAGALSVRLT